ncbi:protein translocase subunit SecD [Bacillota bacterium LX-D]|nr:protein translocase subunit SecD [Bacillota bacterium LX-D]
MRWGNIFKLLLVLVIIIAGSILAFNPLLKKIDLGLDLQGGVHVLMEAQETAAHKVTDDDMKQLESVMRQRVDELGVSEPIIQRIGGKRLAVELAGIKNPEEAVEIIGKTALLEFKTADGKTVLTGKDLKDAKATMDNTSGEPEIGLQFNDAGAKTFANITGQLASFPQGDPQRRIAIYLDNELLTAPEVSGPIPNGQARITGGFKSYDDAANTAALLRGGSLPVSTKIIEKRTVGPTLGLDSLEKSKQAVIIGLLAVAIFMLVVYRLPGIIADISLLVFIILILCGLISVKAVLTLPGIAALLLTVGMAADANIIIYERIKDELRNGKTTRAAVEAGFKRAFGTIFDSNLTTIITAVVLFYLGIGSVRGFALNLIIGILLNMFTALTLTRFLLRLFIKIPGLNNKKLYGVRGGAK